MVYKVVYAYDTEIEILEFVHITPTNIYGSKDIPEIFYELGAHNIFGRGYNDF